jgi:hypothetical protein
MEMCMEEKRRRIWFTAVNYDRNFYATGNPLLSFLLSYWCNKLERLRFVSCFKASPGNTN